VRWIVIAACVFGLSSSGCFNPKVKPGGFSCSSTDSDPCPLGFFCVGGLCQATADGGVAVGGNGGPDLAMTSAGDMSGAASLRDMTSTSTSDLTPPGDMTTPPADMLSCSAPGSFCVLGFTCCSGSCSGFQCH
jgi:hypothetical protein